MTSTFSRLRRIEVLLNSLIGEHHARRALLSEVCEELEAAPELAPVRESASMFLVRLEKEPCSESVYARELDQLMTQFRDLAGATLTPGPARAMRDEQARATLAAAS